MSGNRRKLGESRFCLFALGTLRRSGVRLPSLFGFNRPLTALSSLCVCERSHIRAATFFLSQGSELWNSASHSAWSFLVPPTGTKPKTISMLQAYFLSLPDQFSNQLALSTFTWVPLSFQYISTATRHLLGHLHTPFPSFALSLCIFSYSI